MRLCPEDVSGFRIKPELMYSQKAFGMLDTYMQRETKRIFKFESSISRLHRLIHAMIHATSTPS